MAPKPTEINPEMMNKLMKTAKISSNHKFVDVISFETSHLTTPLDSACAVLLIFMPSSKHVELRKKHIEEQKGKQPHSKVYFVKQALENYSGVVGLIHAIANNMDSITFGDNSSLKSYIDGSANSSPDERGKLLETHQALSDYESVAAEGFIRPEGSEHCNVATFVQVDGHLHELDGQIEQPIDHGKISDGSFLENAVKACKQYTEQAKDEVRFSAVALVRHE